MSLRRPLLYSTAIAALLCGACQTPYEAARDRDTPDAYRAFLRENPDDAAAKAASERLSELEFLEARRQHTLIGYKRFLTAFPSASRVPDVELLMEGIRFETAAAADTPEGWLIFLREHPHGPHSTKARERLEAADHREATASGDAKSLRDFLARHPETRHREDVERALDELAFQEASQKGTRGLIAYLQANPVGVHRDEVREEIFAREALAHAHLGAFGKARDIAERIVTPARRQSAIERLDQLELDHLTATFDLRGLEAFLKAHDGAWATSARERIAFLGGRALRPDFQKLRDRTDPEHYTRPVGDLIAVLETTDPRDRWLAAEELGATGELAALDPLLDAAARSRFSRVQRGAVAALARVAEVLPDDARELELYARLDELRKKAAQDTGLFIKIGLLSELLGEPRQALLAYERALQIDPDEHLALVRAVELNRQAGKNFRAGILARELAFRLHQHALRRTEEKGVSPKLIARTLCGMRADARFAEDLFQGLPAETVRDLAEDAAPFSLKTSEARRFIEARLADAEAEARSADRGFRPCDDAGEQPARLAEGEQQRLAAVADIEARQDFLKALLLQKMEERDPSPRVRQAAREALGRAGAPAALPLPASEPTLKEPPPGTDPAAAGGKAP